MDIENTTFSGIGKDFEPKEEKPFGHNLKGKAGSHEDFMNYTKVIGECKECGKEVFGDSKDKNCCTKCKK